MQDGESLEEYRDRIVRYHNADFEQAFQGVKYDFVNAPPEQRIQWLYGWDRALAQENRPTRDHAEWLSKRRELGDLHEAMKKVGR
jgi:ribosome modulation factor